MLTVEKAQVITEGSSQRIVLPASFRFSTEEVYISRDPFTNALTLSEGPASRTVEEILRSLDEAGGVDLEVERDPSLPEDPEAL